MNPIRGAGETQPARTALAWQRTGLGMLVVAGLLVRAAAVDGGPLLAVPAGTVVVAGIVVLGVLAPRRRDAAQRAAEEGGPAQALRPAAVATGLVVLTALCAIAADLLSRR